ncbi:MAG: glycoside hydrolase family 2 protein [Candidatus Hermodarchaeota archaeon]
MTLKTISRPEYPRPQFVRKNNWINLNGLWDFSFDDENVGLKERWYLKKQHAKFNEKINVPFCFQSELSGINDQSFHDVVWYKREFIQSENFKHKRVYLNFGAVDYSCKVYLNEHFIGSHEGGYSSFNFDITNFLNNKKNDLVLRVEDPSRDCEIPRGKQFWEKEHETSAIFYPRITGIWQTVWLETVNLDYYVKNVKITPDIDQLQIMVECEVFGIGFGDLRMDISVLFAKDLISKIELNLDFLGDLSKKRKGKDFVKEKQGYYEKRMGFRKNANSFKFKIEIPENELRLWDDKNPDLYDIILKLYDKKTQEIYDNIKSYFGMREISIVNGKLNKKVLLNHKELYQKLFLVQGYWSQGLYTAPSEEDIKLDIQYVKDFGFNGIRTHQKAFDPIFLYWCDKMGVLIWGEMGSAFMFSAKSELRFINQSIEMIERDYNHPSIIAWVLLNEGWGVNNAEKDKRMVDFTVSLYYLIKSIDPTRLIIDDDGWWHTKTDLCTKHFYLPLKFLPKNFNEELKFEGYGRAIPKFYLKPFQYLDEPIIYSEIGGYGLDYDNSSEKKYSYGEYKNAEELFDAVLILLKEFDARKKWIHGFCYTELYDQFQEINGLLTMHRKPKFPPEQLKKELDKLFY